LYPIGERVFSIETQSIVGHDIGANIIKWHYYLSYLHIHVIFEIQNNSQHVFHNLPVCEGCVVGKQNKIPFFSK
jgi:hypothetical protein